MDILTRIIICLLVADFITGLFHWLEDTYGTISDSWMSKNIWEPNILHHKYPTNITQNTFINRNYIQWGMAISFSLPLYFILNYYNSLTWEPFLALTISSFGNEFHCWSHNKKNYWLVEFLQDTCIIQTKSHHHKHHIKPYSCRYCVITNLLNPILEIVNFWRILELVLSPLVSVKRGDANRKGY